MESRRRIACLALAGAALALTLPALGDHTPIGPVEPGNDEQLGIYEVNRARSNPEAYGDEIQLDLTGVSRRPPLAVNKSLTGSARFHAVEMLDHGYFAHTSAVTGDGPNQMAVDHGYDVFGNGLGKDWGAVNNIESIAAVSGSFKFDDGFPDAIDRLITDKDIPSLGHRIHLLAMEPFWAQHREIGCGEAAFVTSSDTRYRYAIHTSYTATGDTFITGVVYRDTNGSGRYDLGEGIGGAAVTAGAFATTSMAAGGYSLKVPAGNYTVSCTGGSFVGVATSPVVVAGESMEVDFTSGEATGEVDFEFQFGGGPGPGPGPTPVPPVVDAGASQTTGPAPLLVDFTGTSPSEDAVFSWEFGDGGIANGENVSHTFTEPGLYTVVLKGTNAAGTGSSLVVIAVSGAAGTGAGTTPPASNALTPLKVKSKVNFAKFGKDSMKLTAKIEMPEGFVPGAHPIQVSVGGVKIELTLTEKNKAVDAAKNKVVLKYKKPKGGAPLAAGVTGKLNATLKGDLAEVLAALGMRNTTETVTLTDVPFAFLLEEFVYRGAANLAVKSKEGKKSKGKLPK